jgi:hypothetical protein
LFARNKSEIRTLHFKVKSHRGKVQKVKLINEVCDHQWNPTFNLFLQSLPSCGILVIALYSHQ